MCLRYIILVPLLGSLIMLHILIAFNLFLLLYFVPQREASYIVWCTSMRLYIISLRSVNYWLRGILATIKCMCLCVYCDSDITVIMSSELCHFGLWVTTGSLRYKLLERTFETRRHGKFMIQCFWKFTYRLLETEIKHISASAALVLIFESPQALWRCDTKSLEDLLKPQQPCRNPIMEGGYIGLLLLHNSN